VAAPDRERHATPSTSSLRAGTVTIFSQRVLDDAVLDNLFRE
jgi:hypothetical protein